MNKLQPPSDLQRINEAQIAYSDVIIKLELKRLDAQSAPKANSFVQDFGHPISNNSKLPNREIHFKRHPIIEVFANTCKRWQLEKEQQLILLGFSEGGTTGGELLTRQTTDLPRDVEDRAGFVIGIGLGLSAIFGNQSEAELSWLKLNRNLLDCKSAIDYMLEGGMLNLISWLVKAEKTEKFQVNQGKWTGFTNLY